MLLYYKGRNLIDSIPKSELIANARFTIRTPYIDERDANSLKVEITRCIGCKCFNRSISFKYDRKKEEAVALIDWGSVKMEKSLAFVEIGLKANYDFARSVHFSILNVDDYFSFVPENNLIGRGKLQIGTLQIKKICDNRNIIGFETNQHRIEVAKEISGNKNVVVTIDEADHLAKSDVLEVPLNKSQDVKVFMDFGEEGISELFSYTFSFMLNGEKVSFESKAITINPYVPQLKHRIELNKNEDGVAKQDLQNEAKTVGYLYVSSDAIRGEQSIKYSLKTDSKILTLGNEIHGKENTISPLESVHQFPLIFNGTELPNLPESTIDVKIKNGEEGIDSIHLIRKPLEANLDNSILLTAPAFSKINNGDSFSKTVYFGNNNQIELPFEITKDVADVGLCIKPSDIDFASFSTPTHYPELNKGKTSIIVGLTPELAVGKKDFIVCASAPYYKDAKCEITIDCKEKKIPKIKFAFDPVSKVNNDKIVVYTDGLSEKIGKLTLQCCAGNGVQNPRKEHYKAVNLKSDLIILQDNYSIIQLIQQGEQADQKEVLLLGESVSYDVMVEPYKAEGPGELNLSFKCLNDQTNNVPKIVIKNKIPEDRPSFSFQSELEIIYPVNQDRIKVGALSVTIPEKQKGRYDRENGVVFFDECSHFYFSNEEKDCCCIKISEIKEPIPIYFDAYNCFECVQNIEKDKTVQLPLEYKDDNVDKEPVSADMENGQFVVKQYPANPIPEIVFVDAKEREKIVLFDDSLKAEVVASEGIQYTQAMLNLPPGRKFKLKLKNSQKNSLPRKYIRISGLKADKGFVLLEAKGEYCIYNGENEEVVDIKIDWRKVQGGCSGFAISGEIDGRSFVINVKCQIYEKIATNWRSLDLGTSAIVLAKMHRDNINTVIDTVKLADSEMSLESHEDMISSIIALYKGDDSDCHELVLSPERKKYNQATAILPPIKFLVGQSSIPFADSFQSKGVRKLKSQFLEEVELYKVSPNIILESVYKDVFSRIEKTEQEEIKKLILTYPSTYTKEQITSLKNLVLEKFPNIQEQNLGFVAESDAVLAQYLYENRTTIDDKPLKDDEKILIYDMGAGTLDISYVRIKVENQGKKNQITKAIIEKRIGVPVAGNYLDYCIFEYLKPYLADEALADPVAIKTLKKNIQELKIKISEKSGEGNLALEFLTDFVLKEQSVISYQAIIDSENVQSFFNACSDDVFKLLLGDQWKNEKVTFVYSGRGCLFKPLIDHIKTISGWNPEPVSSSPEEMKLCAAKGAIRYSQMFSKDCQQPFEIESFKYYASFGLVYRTYADDGNTETYKCEILKSADDFRVLEKENLHSKISGIDIRPTGPIILVQSYLPPERISKSFNNIHQKKEDKDGCYITEIFRVFREELGLEDSDLQEAWAEFSIDDYNDTIKCTIMDQPLNDYKFSESIENNDYYKKSMWPFNN